MSTITTLGPVGFNPKGEYNSETLYERLDLVLYQGVSYVAKQDVQGQIPTNSTYWDRLGISGADMTNYYTKNEANALLDEKQDLISNDNKLSSDLVDDSNNEHKFVSETEKTNWNNKSDFSGSYNDLSNKPTIPSKTSDLTNDSGFIINSVNNLTNYYTKTDIDNLVGDINTALDTINGEVI